MHPTLILGTTVAAAAVAYALKPKKKTALEVSSIPVPVIPAYLPFQLDAVFSYIIGTLAGGDELEGLRSAVLDHGKNINLRGMNEDFILVTDPENIKHILAKAQPNYEKGAEFNAIFHEFLGQGIFNSDGEQWRVQRAIARPHFQTTEFKDSILINKHVDHLLQVIQKRMVVQPDAPIEVQDLFCRFTLDAATDFLFGETVNALEHEHTDFSTAFNYAQSITAWRFRVPMWRYLVPKRRLVREIKILDDFVYKIIDRAVDRQKERHAEEKQVDESKGNDTLLEHFLTHQKESDFSKTYLRDLLLNFLIAGRDTTASLLSWTMWQLVQHPKVVERLRAEIREVVGDNGIPDYVAIKKMKYQKQVINEVLRLCPPVPFNIRQSVSEDVLPNGMYIPAGVPVTYSAYITHRDTTLWGEDALEFDPDRWGPERVGSIKPFMFVAFHAGPRICLGQNFAYTEAMVTLTRLLQVFDIEAVPGFQPKQMGDIVLFSKNGVQVQFKKRQTSEF